MKSPIHISIIIVSFFFIGACSKPKLDLKFVGAWKPQDSSNTATTTFSADHTWKTCHANGDVSTSGTWIIKGNQLFVTMTDSTPPDPVIYDIQKVDGSSYIMTHKNEKTGVVHTTKMIKSSSDLILPNKALQPTPSRHAILFHERLPTPITRRPTPTRARGG